MKVKDISRRDVLKGTMALILTVPLLGMARKPHVWTLELVGKNGEPVTEPQVVGRDGNVRFDFLYSAAVYGCGGMKDGRRLFPIRYFEGGPYYMTPGDGFTVHLDGDIPLLEWL